MSRYHSVRPKSPHSKHQQVPTPAAPAQPGAPAAAKQRKVELEEYARHIYRVRNGQELDDSIDRARKLLAIYDRELEILAKGDGEKQHRWTVSPSIAFRFDKLLHELLDRRERLKIECWVEAKRIMAEQSNEAKADSLCPPKSPEPAQNKGFMAEAPGPQSVARADEPQPIPQPQHAAA